MPLRITCPQCKGKFAVDGALRGKRVSCPKCKKPLTIPAPKDAAAIPPGTSPAGVSQRIKAKPKLAFPTAIPAPDTETTQANPKSVASKTRQSGKSGSALPVVLLVGGGVAALGVLFLAIGGVAAYFYFASPGQNKQANKAGLGQLQPKANTLETSKGGTADERNGLESAPFTPPSSKTEINPQEPPPPKAKTAPKTNPKPAPKKPKDKSNPPPPQSKSAFPPAAGQLDKNILAKVKQATVYIRVTLGGGGVAQGSGFFGIEPGLVLTNAHVVGMLGNDTLPPKKVEIVFKSGEPDSRTFLGTILGVDRSSDLALLRVAGEALPQPLAVTPAADLVETQHVYVVGFPFGAQLGKNVTVSQSSVSSLRKGLNGELVKVQVNGGMHPGNSGGPVVNASGDVVGVAVSGIEGTQINFAVPGEYVHIVLNGRVAGVSSGTTVRDGANIKMRVNMDLLDPLNRVQDVACDWWIAPSGKSRPPANNQPSQAPGDSPHERLALTYAGGKAQGDIIVPPNIPPGHVIHIQPVVTNGSGLAKWSESVTFVPSTPVERMAALLTLKHYWGARPLTFTTNAILKLSKPGIDDLNYSVGVNATMTETMVGQLKPDAALRLRYLKYEIGVPTKLVSQQGHARTKRLVQQIGTLHADLLVDDRNNLKKNTVDTTKLPAESRADLIDLHSQIQDSLEVLSVPLPGKKTQPGHSWTAKRSLLIFTGDRGDPARMNVTYTFEGVRQYDGRPEAVISINGVASDQVDGKANAVGRITGTAHLDLVSFQISSANANAELTLSDDAGKNINVVLKCSMERKLGKELLKVASQLTQKDQRDPKGNPYKAHTVKLEGGKPCVVSLESAPGKGHFDTVLRVEDSTGNVLAKDNDNGVDLNSLVLFTPEQSGAYRIICTCDRPTLGNYLLVVRQ